ncbi:MAG: trypsin-like peptidase domain-containing protein [Planctomycetota bacterium]
MHRLLPLVLAIASAAQARAQDDDALLQTEQAILAASEKLGPSIVRIETFGGRRRVLGDESGQDQLGGIQPSKMPKEILEDLLKKADPFELGELWDQLGLPPRAADKAFDVEDLRQLGDRELDRLCRKYQVGPFDPEKKDEKEKKDDGKRGLGPLVQPGFLQAQGASTGIVISKDGWILTSRFALNFDPSTILVSLADGRAFSARRAGEDTSRGIALLKIEADDLQPVDFADPKLGEVGRSVFVLGRTFAPTGRPTVHSGIVSARDRLYGRALQIDAWTSPANYGGPVVDIDGRVLGIAVPLSPSGRDAGVDWHDSGIGFATTIADIAPLMERMQRGETLHRAWLGVALDPSDLGPGAVIQSLVPRSPAAGLGLRRGTRITAVDGTKVRNSFHAQILIGAHMAGDEITLALEQDGAAREARVRLLATPSAEREERSRAQETAELPWNRDSKPEDGSGR